MSTAPRIYRTEPRGPVVEAPSPIPVIVTMEWILSDPSDLDGHAVAWTRNAVEVEWDWHGQTRRDWVAAWQVRRPGQPPRPPDRGDAPPRVNTRKARW